MIFTIFVIIVFISEVIIAVAVLNSLVKLDRTILNLNLTIKDAKVELKEICILVRNISGQIMALVQKFLKDSQHKSEDFAMKMISKLLLTTILVKINSKMLMKLRKSKIAKIIGKGFSLLEIMV